MSSPQPPIIRKNLSPFALTGLALAFLFCLICLCIGFAAYLLFFSQGQFQSSSIFSSRTATPTPAVVRPSEVFETESVDPTQSPTLPSVIPPSKEEQIAPPPPSTHLSASENLSKIEDTHIPLSDPVELARRLGGLGSIPRTLEPPDAPYLVGRRESFWVGNMDTNAAFQIPAVLQFITEHAYFWIQEGLAYNEDDLQSMAQAFEEHIYPTTRAFFGSEWSPGVDGDPRIYILYASGLGRDLAGYFSATDEYPPAVHEYSNGHEIFLFNADVVSLGQPYTYGVLAHEFQHMILWNRDRNEASWLNEGLSVLAAFINGYYDGGFDLQYIRNPDLQLNDWPNHHAGTAAHYGASFLFLNYFMGRLGEEPTKAIVGEPEDGFSGLDAVLEQYQVYDPLREGYLSTDEIFLDWAVTNYLNDAQVGDGRYMYTLYPQAPRAFETENIRSCPTSNQTRDVAQYGGDYIRVTCAGEYTLHFEGSIQTKLLPTEPHSGSYAFWSNKGDESEMTLTRQFDLSSLEAPLSLSYWTWYDIEDDYDYLYLLASSDGESWQILRTPSSTSEDPSGNSFGWAYNGVSGLQPPASWIQETIDISQFAGDTVYLRFEYVTDAALYGEGFLLDDVSIPQADYFSDFESDDGGWESNGWVRVQNVLPQTFQLALITFGQTTSVEYLPLGDDVTLDIPILIGDEVDEVVLVVAGTTRHTRQRAAYQFSVIP